MTGIQMIVPRKTATYIGDDSYFVSEEGFLMAG